MLDKLKTKKGFTIIEVVIVLAIAALIIVIVLLAIAALQRSQRTKAAQDYAGQVLSQVQQAMSDAQASGTAIAVGQAVGAAYFPAASRPAGYGAPGNNAAAAGAFGATNYHVGGVCGGSGAIAATGNTSQYAVSYWSESAGGAVCIHN